MAESYAYRLTLAQVGPVHDPAWIQATDAVKRQLLRAVVVFGLEAKDKELAAGLDYHGVPFTKLAASTKKHRKSAMGPASPNAPPLMPARALSRTRSLLGGRSMLAKGEAEFFWRADEDTGKPWSRILAYHRQGGPHLPIRNVFGLSPRGVSEVRRQTMVWWRAYARATMNATLTEADRIQAAWTKAGKAELGPRPRLKPKVVAKPRTTIPIPLVKVTPKPIVKPIDKTITPIVAVKVAAMKGSTKGAHDVNYLPRGAKPTNTRKIQVYYKEESKPPPPKQVTPPPAKPKPAKPEPAPVPPIKQYGAPSPYLVAVAALVVKSLPPKVKAALVAHHVEVAVAKKITEAAPDLAGQHPRGWVAGKTWENAEGVYRTQAKQVVVAETFVDLATGKPVASNRFHGVLRHELGHAFDHALGDHSFNDATFRTAYEADLRNHDSEAVANLGYFRQPGDAGPSEAFAEIFAQLVGGTGSGRTNLAAYFPRVLQLIAGLLQ